MATVIVSLQPGESKLVSFEATPTIAKTYQVSVNGLTGSFRAVSPLEVPPFSVVIGVSDTTPDIGEAISWWVDITNISDAAAIPRIDWYIDGVTPGHSHPPSIAPGASRRVYYDISLSFSTSGTHTLEVKVGTGDGEIVGGVTAKITIEVITPPTSNYLLMTKTELYSYLINRSVSRDWWGITDNDRRSLAKKIIEWWSYPIRAYVIAKGGSGCLTPPSYDPYLNPVENPYVCECHCEASLRYLRLGSKEGCPTNRYYWEQLEDKWKCVPPDYDFKLPIVIVGVSKASFGHWICGIQVGTDQMVFGNWIFFNLDEIVAPGNPRQMPSGSTVGLFNVTGVDSWGMVDMALHPFVTFTV